MWGLPEVGKTARGGKEEEKKKRSVRQHCFHDAPGATTYDDNICVPGRLDIHTLPGNIEHDELKIAHS
jgi:hypothetical protein